MESRGEDFKKKLYASSFVAGVILFSLIGSIYIFTINERRSAEALENLTVVREIKKSQVEEFIGVRVDLVNNISKNKVIVDMLQSFGSYVSQGNQPLEATDDVSNADFFGILNKIKEKFNFLDLTLVSATGDVFHYDGKQSMLLQNLLTGDLKTSDTAICFQRAQEGTSLLIYDVYPAIDKKKILIIGAPVYLNGNEKKSRELVGVVLLKVDSSPINVMMVQRNTSREKGVSTFLIGKKRIKSDFQNNTISIGNVKTDKADDLYTISYIEKALSGQSGQGIFQENRSSQLVSYAPLDVQGLDWAIVSKILQSEAFDALDKRWWHMVIVVIIGIVVILEVGVLICWLSSKTFSSWYWKI